MYDDLNDVGQRRPQELVDKVLANVKGPFVHNVVASAEHKAKSRVFKSEIHRLFYIPELECDKSLPVGELAWVIPGRHNAGDYANPLIVPTTDHGTLSVFPKGPINIAGCKSPEHACFSMAIIVGEINERGMKAGYLDAPIEVSNFRVTNIQSTGYMNAKLDLDAMHAVFAGSVLEKDKIRHLRLDMPPPWNTVTVLVYQSGNLVLTGASTVEQLQAAFKRIAPVLAQFVI